MTSIKVSRDIIPFFDQAVVEIFDTMLEKKVTKVGNYLDKAVMKPFYISAMMGFSGEINGNAAVSFTNKHSSEVVSNLLKEEISPDNEEFIQDGVGEMINMIVGQAKALLAGKISIDICLPIIIVGNSHEIWVKDDIPQVFLLYDCEGTQFSVQMAFKLK